MTTNLKSRITVLEQLREASLPPLFINTRDDEPMTPEQKATMAEAKAEGRRVIILINAPDV